MTNEVWYPRLVFNPTELFIEGTRLYIHTLNFVGMHTSNVAVASIVSQTVMASSGDHCEIGTWVGGSAILAALSFKDDVDRHVYTIDPMDKLDSSTYTEDTKGSYELFSRNVEKSGMSDRITLAQEFSDPFPFPGQEFGTAYIDGSHQYEWVRKDWDNLKDCVRDYIVFDDVGVPDVYKVIIEAAQDPEWSLIQFIYSRVAVFARRPISDKDSIKDAVMLTEQKPVLLVVIDEEKSSANS